MNAVIAYLRSLVGRNKDIQSIISPINKIVRDLEAYSAREKAKAVKNEDKVKKAAAKAEAGHKSAAEAVALASNYKTLIQP